MSQNDSKDGVEVDGAVGGAIGSGMFSLIISIVCLCSLVPIIWSFVCLGRSGSGGEKAGGIAIAWFLGPFYWCYYYFLKSYCRK